MKRAIIIMAKIPLAGKVKTRLQPFLSAEDSAELAAAFLQDTLNKAAKLNAEIIIAFSPPDRKNYFDDLRIQNFTLKKQPDGNLGEKISAAFQFAFEIGMDSAVLIGTDSPTFPPEFIQKSFELLEINCDAVLGKTIDGGFYLIGLRKPDKRIFEMVQWSSEKTFEQTAENIKNLNLKLAKLPVWYDVDVPADLERLENELAQKPEAAPKTREYLKKLKRKEINKS
jgi:uncharacterized protein